jgi:hypothetical protein
MGGAEQYQSRGYSSVHRTVALDIYPLDWAGDATNDALSVGE